MTELAIGFAAALLLSWLLGALLRRARREPSRPREATATKKQKHASRAPTAQATQARLPLPFEPDEDVTLLYRGGPDLFAPAFELDQSDGLANAPATPTSESRVKLCFEEDADEEETTSPLARILLTARADSDAGRKRGENEDSLLFFPERSLFAVADGMGGYQGGRVASTLAVETLRQAFETELYGGLPSTARPIPRRGHELASAILQANTAVNEAARATPELSKMGTTLVAARFSPNKQRVYIGHVGDSRCYRLRAGRLRQLTTDQTMRLVGMRGPGADDLLQAIGVTRDLSVDLIVDKPRPDDIYLLCSDGLPKMVSDAAIERALVEQPDIEAAVYALIELANDNGGVDNVTVILIKVLERAARAATTSGWSRLPHVSASGVHDEPTVVGGLALDEPTLFGPVPTPKKMARRP
jgi:serine/threonine protein phosphatase PrpC